VRVGGTSTRRKCPFMLQLALVWRVQKGLLRTALHLVLIHISPLAFGATHVRTSSNPCVGFYRMKYSLIGYRACRDQHQRVLVADPDVSEEQN
jgi:hypothetical protein